MNLLYPFTGLLFSSSIAAAIVHGNPVRLKFHREESASFSETVLLPDFEKVRSDRPMNPSLWSLSRVSRANTNSPVRWACSAAN